MDDKAKYKELKDKLKNAGCDVDIHYAGTKGFVFPDEYDHIILEYFGAFKGDNFNSHMMHCIVKPKKYSLIPVLLEQFHSASFSNSYKWTLGDGLYIIGYKDEYFHDYMEIAGNVKYGHARGMVVWLLGRSKRHEALELLINLMQTSDHDVMLYTLSALNLFKSEPQRVYEEVRKFADDLISEKGKEKYIKDMYTVRYQLHKDYTDAEKKRDVQGMYTEVIRLVNKILKRYGDEIPKECRKLFAKKSVR